MVLRSSQPRNYRSVGDNGARLPRRQWSRTVCYAVRFCFCFLILHTLHVICQLSFLPFIPHTFLAKYMQNASASIAESALLFVIYFYAYTILHVYTSLLLQIFLHTLHAIYQLSFLFLFHTLFLQSACKMLSRLAHFAYDLPTFSSSFSSSHFSCKVHAEC